MIKYKIVGTENTKWMRDHYMGDVDSLYKAFGKETFTKEEAVSCLERTAPWTIWQNGEMNFQYLLRSGRIVMVPKRFYAFRVFFRNLLDKIKNNKGGGTELDVMKYLDEVETQLETTAKEKD